jgi:hypothetical protein
LVCLDQEKSGNPCKIPQGRGQCFKRWRWGSKRETNDGRVIKKPFQGFFPAKNGFNSENVIFRFSLPQFQVDNIFAFLCRNFKRTTFSLFFVAISSGQHFLAF